MSPAPGMRRVYREYLGRRWLGPRNKFVHVIATRMGIGIADPAWFDVRLKLFEIVTLASVRAQTCQDFVWCVAIGKDMPVEAREKLHEMLSCLPNTHILTCRYRVDFLPALHKYCAKLCRSRTSGYLMTTRLDDDDALEVSAIATLQDAADGYMKGVARPSPAVFSFTVGYDWLPWQGTAVRRYHHSLGIGLSLLEPVEKADLVYGHPHKKLALNLASRGAHVQSFGGSSAWWLYTAHQLSDSHKAEAARITRLERHEDRLVLDAPELGRFGLDPARVQSLKSLADVSAAKPLYRLSVAPLRLEQELRRLRQELKSGSCNDQERKELRRKISELERERLLSVQHLVQQ